MDLGFAGLIGAVTLDRERVESFKSYPFSVPAVRGLDELALDPYVTFLVGENGSGKSTLIEAIAVAAGFNAEGGTRNFDFETKASHSELHQFVRVERGWRKVRDGFFLRAESFYNVATQVDELGVTEFYGGRSLHACSHGEAFLALVQHRFGPDGLYVLDEPESALSPTRQLSLLAAMDGLVRQGSQFVVATHSPILLAYPHATIYELSSAGIRRVAYEETEHFQLTRDFLVDREQFLKHLVEPDPPGKPARGGESGKKKKKKRGAARDAW